jgi:hypothetical protein
MTIPTNRALAVLADIPEMNLPQLASVFWALAAAFTEHGRQLRFAVQEHPDANADQLMELEAQIEDIDWSEARG